MSKSQRQSPSSRLENYLKPIPSDKPLGPHYALQKAAWLMGMSSKWIASEIEAGRLDGFLFGNKIVVSLESINARLEMARITGEAKRSAESPDQEQEEDES